MTRTARPSWIPAALAACTCLTTLTLACNIDEPATYLPRAGAWGFTEVNEVNRTCDAQVMLPPQQGFVVDDAMDDTFQVEAGADDIHCEIDGVDFYCGALVLFSDTSPDFDVTLTYTSTWEGEFESTTVVSGTQTLSGACTGEDCNLFDDAYPCTVEVEFAAEFLD